MNYLQLCQRCAGECIGSAAALTTTAGQIGSLLRIVNWVNDAWDDLQTDHDDWDWMRSSNILGAGASFVPAAGQFTTPLGTSAGQIGIDPDTFGKWDVETFRCFVTTVGTQSELFLDEIPFDTWRDAYMFGAMRQVQTRPVAIAVGPDLSLNLGPPPNGQYTITGDYFVAASDMAADTDEPVGLPKRYHMLIVYRAMKKYAGYEAAPEVMTRAIEESSRLEAELAALRLPRMSFSGSVDA